MGAGNGSVEVSTIGIPAGLLEMDISAGGAHRTFSWLLANPSVGGRLGELAFCEVSLKWASKPPVTG